MSCESRFADAAKAIIAAQPDSKITAEDLAMAFHLKQAKIDRRSLETILDVASIAMQDEVTVEDDQGDQPLRQYEADKGLKLKRLRSQVNNFQAQTELPLDIAATKVAGGGKAKKKLTKKHAAEVEEGIRTFSEDADWLQGDGATWLYEIASDLRGGGYGLDGAAADYISCSNDYENHPKNSRLRDKTQELGTVLYKQLAARAESSPAKKQTPTPKKTQRHCDQCKRPLSSATYQRGQGLCAECSRAIN